MTLKKKLNKKMNQQNVWYIRLYYLNKKVYKQVLQKDKLLNDLINQSKDNSILLGTF